MEKRLSCKDVGADCDFVICAKTEEEIFQKARPPVGSSGLGLLFLTGARRQSDSYPLYDQSSPDSDSGHQVQDHQVRGVTHHQLRS